MGAMPGHKLPRYWQCSDAKIVKWTIFKTSTEIQTSSFRTSLMNQILFVGLTFSGLLFFLSGIGIIHIMTIVPLIYDR